MRRFLTAFVFFAVLLAVWHFGRDYMVNHAAKRWSPVLFPSPLSVWQYLVSAVQDRTFSRRWA